MIIIPILGNCDKKIIRNAGKSVYCSIFHYNRSRQRNIVHPLKTKNKKPIMLSEKSQDLKLWFTQLYEIYIQ